METSFHLLACYVAARRAGFDKRAAKMIALCSEGVDHSIYGPDDNSSGKARKDTLGKDRITQTGCYDRHLTRGKIVGGMGKEWQRSKNNIAWMAFHFLPRMDTGGKFAFDIASLYDSKKGTLKKSSDKKEKFISNSTKYINFINSPNNSTAKQSGGKYTFKVGLICRPGSLASNAMMADTMDIVKREVGAVKSGKRWGSVVKKLQLRGQDGAGNKATIESYLKDRNFDIDVKGFLTSLIGVRLHVFADTFAHQGFAGVRGAGLNDLHQFAYEWKRKWYQAKVAVVTKDFHKRAPATVTYYGHGRAGHYPDWPSYEFKYLRGRDGLPVHRKNPEEYAKAMQEMIDFLKGIPRMIRRASVGGGEWSKGVARSVTAKGFFEKPSEEEWDTKKWSNEWIKRHIEAGDRSPVLGRPWKELAAHHGDNVMDELGTVGRTYFSLAAAYHRYWLVEKLKSVYGTSFKTFMETALG